jgi:hypothetical protein
MQFVLSSATLASNAAMIVSTAGMLPPETVVRGVDVCSRAKLDVGPSSRIENMRDSDLREKQRGAEGAGLNRGRPWFERKVDILMGREPGVATSD